MYYTILYKTKTNGLKLEGTKQNKTKTKKRVQELAQETEIHLLYQESHKST